MVGNEEKTQKKAEKEVLFSFRLSEEDKSDLNELANILADNNKSYFLVQCIRKFKAHPEQFSTLSNDSVTELKKEISSFRDEFTKQQKFNFEQNQKSLETLEQMTTLLLHQKENGIAENFHEKMKETLKTYKERFSLDTYKKVADYLVSIYPKEKEKILQDRIYNDALLELLQEQFVEYKVRTKKLNWLK